MTRACPRNRRRRAQHWHLPARTLSTRLLTDQNKNEAFFLGRFGIHRVVTQYATTTSKALPTVATERVGRCLIRHTTLPLPACRHRHQYDPRLGPSSIAGHNAYLRRSRHRNESQVVGPGQYQRLEGASSLTLSAAIDGIPESHAGNNHRLFMCRAEPGKSQTSLTHVAPDPFESSENAAEAAKVCARVTGTGKHITVACSTDASQLSGAGILCIIESKTAEPAITAASALRVPEPLARPKKVIRARPCSFPMYSQ